MSDLSDTIRKIAETKRLHLANLPTPIEKLSRISKEWGVDLWVKRDDLSGSETSGNKIRKLEYTVAKALDLGAQVLITCGGIQSNHCRATAAVAAKMGIKSHLVLRIDDTPPLEGNYLLDKILGAKITFISRPDYSNRRGEIMADIAKKYEEQGIRAYVIPEGASDGTGNLGYIHAVEEITKQEEELGVKFDAIVCAVGSGGTYSGLFLGSKIYSPEKTVYGFNVCDDEEYFLNVCETIAKDTVESLGADIEVRREDMHIIDGYKGEGYAISTTEELSFITDIARKEGIIFDPVYTGKAFIGLADKIKKGFFTKHKHILFIHTGGHFGLFPKQGQFEEVVK